MSRSSRSSGELGFHRCQSSLELDVDAASSVLWRGRSCQSTLELDVDADIVATAVVAPVEARQRQLQQPKRSGPKQVGVGDAEESEIEPDVDGAALLRHTKRRRMRSKGKWFPDGPSSLDGCLDWARSHMEGLRKSCMASGKPHCDELLRTFQDGVVMTSSYSGVGTAEAVMADIWSEVEATWTLSDSSVSPLPPVLFYSVTEKLPAAVRCLKVHARR